MKLIILNVRFESSEDFMNDIRKSLFEGKDPSKGNKDLSFDSIETFKRFMSQNKLQILIAISRRRPESIYQLEKLLSRKYPHVLKDCRQLEAFGFIKLVDIKGAKKQLQPKLIFDYDLIKVNSELEEIFLISERSNKVLLEANAGQPPPSPKVL